jgi:hypothetical protein
MKKISILFLLSFLLLSTSAQELSKSRSNFKGGVRLGFSATQISGDNLAGYNKLGAYTGAFTNFPVSKDGKWKLQMELNFIMKGSSTYTPKKSNAILTNKYVLTLFYTETPLLAKYNFYKGLEIETGPSFNFLFATKEIDAQGDLHRSPFNVFELSYIVGISYLFKEHWGVNLRWSTSVFPVRIPDWQYNEKIKKQYNDVLAFSLYYQF